MSPGPRFLCPSMHRRVQICVAFHLTHRGLGTLLDSRLFIGSVQWGGSCALGLRFPRNRLAAPLPRVGGSGVQAAVQHYRTKSKQVQETVNTNQELYRESISPVRVTSRGRDFHLPDPHLPHLQASISLAFIHRWFRPSGPAPLRPPVLRGCENGSSTRLRSIPSSPAPNCPVRPRPPVDSPTSGPAIGRG